MTLTPAQNYARTKSLGKFPKTRKFAESFPFELDPFQVEACHALESGKGVLVAAPISCLLWFMDSSKKW